MEHPKFGPFQHAFSAQGGEQPGYLQLLWLDRDDCQIALDRIATALSLGDTERWIAALFDDPDWRPHLVGALALLLGRDAHLDAAPLWRALDAGSWVTPQLVVTAFYADPLFAARVRERVGDGCRINVPTGLSAPQRHSATGPADSVARSGKAMACLVSVGSWLPSLAPWLAERASSRRTAEVLAQDIDEAPLIATRWHSELTQQFARRGVVLTPPEQSG